MVKREIPELHENVLEIKYIGPKQSQSLYEENIYTCEDLVNALVNFGESWEQDYLVRRRVRDWLRKVLRNERGGSCVEISKMIEQEERQYLVRHTNEKGYNSILRVWRHYVNNPYKRWIPRKYRGRKVTRSYPLKCKV
jgi:hypothetical protein